MKTHNSHHSQDSNRDTKSNNHKQPYINGEVLRDVANTTKIAKEAHEKKGLSGCLSGAGTGVMTTIIITFFLPLLAPITVPILIVLIVFGSIYGWADTDN